MQYEVLMFSFITYIRTCLMVFTDKYFCIDDWFEQNIGIQYATPPSTWVQIV